MSSPQPHWPPAAAAPFATKPLQVDGAPAIGRWAAEWQRLESAGARANPFTGFVWQASWMETQSATVRPRLFAEIFPDRRLAGLLACQYVRRRGLRFLELAGQGSGGDEIDCLSDPAADAGLPGRLLCAALATPGWDVLRMESVCATGGLANAFAAIAGGRSQPGEWLPYLPLPASFESLLGSHSANFREQLRRRRRQFARAFPGYRIDCLREGDAIEAGLECLFRLHNLRRTQKHERGVFESAPMREFHRRVALRLALQGQARLYLLHTPATTVAALYGFATADRFFFFQSGIDPDAAAAGPGTMLLSAVIEDCIAQGLRQFEFLRGEESYKGRWTDRRRRSVDLYAWRGLRGHAYRRFCEWARHGRRLGRALTTALPRVAGEG